MKILITGGNGFLGRNLGKTLLNDGHEILLASRNNKANFLAANDTKCKTAPLDITSRASVDDVIDIFNPELVIHAAATKFVDLSEDFPNETIDVNVLGSQNILRSCINKKIKYIIGISTDKASPPVRNTYGLSKSIMERLFCSMAFKSDTLISCVRYGNVAWSTGSVLVQWKKQYEEHGKIITCGPNMFRYLFTVHDACKLVKTAIHNIENINGKLLTFDMKAVQIRRILDLLSNRLDFQYEEVPARQGERDTEFLVGESELQHADKIVIDNSLHYLLDFRNSLKKDDFVINSPISAKTSQQMSDEEILRILNVGDFNL